MEEKGQKTELSGQKTPVSFSCPDIEILKQTRDKYLMANINQKKEEKANEFVENAKVIPGENTLVKLFKSPFGIIRWNRQEKTVDVAGSIWTEEEILGMHRRGTGPSKFELELKRNFKNTNLIMIREYGNDEESAREAAFEAVRRRSN